MEFDHYQKFIARFLFQLLELKQFLTQFKDGFEGSLSAEHIF
jgi:hypothetical protein